MDFDTNRQREPLIAEIKDALGHLVAS